MSIGNEIKNRREAAGLTQAELAREVCISQSLVAQFENGYKLPSLGTLGRIADVLKTTPAELLTGSNNRKGVHS